MIDFTRRDFGQALLAGGMLSHLPEQNAAPQPAASASAGSLIDVPGIRVGHFTDPRRPTGCTAILFDPDAAAGVDYATSAPGDRCSCWTISSSFSPPPQRPWRVSPRRLQT